MRNGADFSFAGLKTAVRALCQKHLPKQEAAAADGTDGDALRANIAACFQSRAVQHLSQRVERALRWAKEASEQAGTPLQGMVVAGGVAANKTFLLDRAVSRATFLDLYFDLNILCWVGNYSY